MSNNLNNSMIQFHTRQWRDHMGLQGEGLPTLEELQALKWHGAKTIAEGHVHSWEPVVDQDLQMVPLLNKDYQYGVIMVDLHYSIPRYLDLRFGPVKLRLRMLSDSCLVRTPMLVNKRKDHRYWSLGGHNENYGHTPGFKVENLYDNYTTRYPYGKIA